MRRFIDEEAEESDEDEQEESDSEAEIKHKQKSQYYEAKDLERKNRFDISRMQSHYEEVGEEDDDEMDMNEEEGAVDSSK